MFDGCSGLSSVWWSINFWDQGLLMNGLECVFGHVGVWSDLYLIASYSAISKCNFCISILMFLLHTIAGDDCPLPPIVNGAITTLPTKITYQDQESLSATCDNGYVIKTTCEVMSEITTVCTNGSWSILPSPNIDCRRKYSTY